MFRLRLIPDSVSVDGLQLFRLIGDTPRLREISVFEPMVRCVLAKPVNFKSES